METRTIDHDIKVLYITAASFPNGVMEAHNKLHALAQEAKDRKFYGLSRPEKGVITYMAAMEETYPGEAEKLGCDTIVIKKGEYYTVTINDFMKHLPATGAAFQHILQQPGIDPEGYCVEWYFNDTDVECMVRENLDLHDQ